MVSGALNGQGGGKAVFTMSVLFEGKEFIRTGKKKKKKKGGEREEEPGGGASSIPNHMEVETRGAVLQRRDHCVY